MRNVLNKIRGVYSIEDIEKQAEVCFPFDHFFAGQKEAIVCVVDALINKGVKHAILEAPTGVGKTIIAWTVHRIIDRLIPADKFRTTVTTTTKGLQSQYERDCRAFDLKGKKNYMCPIGHEYYSTLGCKTAVSNRECSPVRDCPYMKRRLTWTDTSLWRVTNSAMFIQMCPMLCMEHKNKADLVVIDECHKFPNSLVDHTQINFDPEQLQIVNTFYGRPSDVYLQAHDIYKALQAEFAGSVGKLISFPDNMVTKMSELNGSLNAFLEMIDNKLKEENLKQEIMEACWKVIERCQDWSDACEIITDCEVRAFIVMSSDSKNGVCIKPVDPAHVSEYSAFRKGDYFLHMSATICGLEAYATSLGIQKEDYVTIEMDHPVEVDRRLVNYIPVAKMSGGEPDENKLRRMLDAIEELATEHEGQNGLIHTASYKLAEALMSRSKLKHKMYIGRDKRHTMEVLSMNAKGNTGIIILSPSMEEGVDLVGNLCRWQVIAKVPFGFLGDPSVRYMADNNQGSYQRETVLRVVQASGRVTRGIDDFGVTYILDESFGSVLSRGAKYFPSWFKEAVTGY